MGKHDSLISTSKSTKCDVHFVKFKRHSIIIKDNDKKTVAINPATKKPYVVQFVDNSSTGKNLGTFKDPFTTLLAAQDASRPFDIIYIFPTGIDNGMNSGITPQRGQLLLGAGKNYHLRTTLGIVKIPAQANGLPIISNTFSTMAIGKAAITLNAGDNTVAGLNLVDNFGGGTGSADVSAGLYIQNGLNYQVVDNTMSTGSLNGGGNCFNIYGGGNLEARGNTLIGRDTGDTFGVNLISFTAPLQGYFTFKNNICTGADNSSGLVRGFDFEVSKAANTFGTIGDLFFSVKGNVFNSQANISEDEPAAITFIINGVSTSTTAKIDENKITIPIGILSPSPPNVIAGIIISSRGPGPLITSLHKNVSLTTPPTVGYFFTNHGNPANLDLDMGYDNFGTSFGP